MSTKLVDGDGCTLAVLVDGVWVDPNGGTFSAKDHADMHAFAADDIDAISFGVPSLQLVTS